MLKIGTSKAWIPGYEAYWNADWAQKEYDIHKRVGLNSMRMSIAAYNVDSFKGFDTAAVKNGLTGNIMYIHGRYTDYKGVEKPPLLASGKVNPDNTLAVYIKKICDLYSDTFDFFLLGNEFDFTEDWRTPATWASKDVAANEVSRNLNTNMAGLKAMCYTAYTVIKKFAAKVKFGIGGLSYVEFAKQMIKAGIDQYLEVFCFHDYPNYQMQNANNWTADFAVSIIANHYTELRKLFPKIPFILGEFGFMNADNSGYKGSQDFQKEATAKLLKWADSVGLYGVYFYTLNDFTATTDSYFGKMGLVTDMANSTPDKVKINGGGQAILDFLTPPKIDYEKLYKELSQKIKDIAQWLPS